MDDSRGPAAPEADPADQDLLRDLARVFAQTGDEDPPETLVAMARAGFGLRILDAELADLVADSLADAAAAGTRSDARTAARLLSFERGDVSLDLETEAGERGCRVIGQVVPTAVWQVEVVHGRGRVAVTTDDLGRFAVDDLPAAPVRVVVSAAGRRPVSTGWFALGRGPATG